MSSTSLDQRVGNPAMTAKAGNAAPGGHHFPMLPGMKVTRWEPRPLKNSPPMQHDPDPAGMSLRIVPGS